MGGQWGSPGHANGVTMAEGWITASYNALNQPMAIWSRNYGSNFLWFGFDPLGRCVKRWKGTVTGVPVDSNPTTYYYYDGWNLVQERLSTTAADRTYVHGGRVDELVASQADGVWYNHHYDAQGNCILLSTMAGGVQEQYDYDAFGFPYFYDASGGTLLSPPRTRFLFTGREWLSDLRIYDYRNRQYQPELGRFLQPDPKEFEAGDYNLYRYCHNDPVNRTDPFGLKWTPAGEATVVHDLTDDEGLVVNGLTGPYDISVLVAIVPGANGTFSLQVAQYDVTVVGKRVAQTTNGIKRSKSEIEESKKHENLHEQHAKDDHDANQNKVLQRGLTPKKAMSERAKEERRLIERFKRNREQDQRDCKRGVGAWKTLTQEENKR